MRDFSGLIFPSAITLPAQHKRIDIIQARVRALAWWLAIGMPAWSVADAYVFPAEMWTPMLAVRLLSGAAFASFLLIGTAFAERRVRSLALIYAQLAAVFFVPALFHIFCRVPLDAGMQTDPLLVKALVHGFYLLPLAMLACIGFFPLAIIESMAIVAVLLAAFITESVDSLWAPGLGADWLMVLLAAIAVATSHSQLRMVLTLVDYSAYDPLTDCLGRRSGEDVIHALCHYAVRNKSHFSIAFIDLDHFKQVNDSYGHPSGDKLLATVAHSIKSALRKSDFVIRWGGEEFLVLMPDATIKDATKVLVRMASKGVGTQPDGKPQTISIGLVERVNDTIDDSLLLVHEADQRLYRAKSAGRNHIVGVDVVDLAHLDVSEPL